MEQLQNQLLCPQLFQMIRVSFIVVGISLPQREIQKPKFLGVGRREMKLKYLLKSIMLETYLCLL